MRGSMYKDFSFQFAICGAHWEYEIHSLFNNFHCSYRLKSNDPKSVTSYMTRKEANRLNTENEIEYHYALELFSIPYGSMDNVKKRVLAHIAT